MVREFCESLEQERELIRNALVLLREVVTEYIEEVEAIVVENEQLKRELEKVTLERDEKKKKECV